LQHYGKLKYKILLTCRARLFLVSLFLVSGIAFSGCALIQPKPQEKKPLPLETWTLENYTTFIAANMARVNTIYSNRYTIIEFVVDTSSGSTKIQNLIQPAAVASILEEIAIDKMDHRNCVVSFHNYVLEKFEFVPAPNRWPTIEETLVSGEGDCKSLSILLLSLLLSANITAHAAISNGHMWVNALYDGNWHVLETDTDPERNRVYALPGFYDSPLYKIYADHSKKRKRLELPDAEPE